jgi:dTDP-4-amino-4,6-dideoxygalactose transaminase
MNNKIYIQTVDSNCERANWMFAVYLIKNNINIDEVNQYFIDNGIEIRPFFYPYYSHHHLKSIMSQTNDYTISNDLNTHIIMLPSYPELTLQQLEYITSKIKLLVNS